MIEKLMTKKGEDATITDVLEGMQKSFLYFEDRFDLLDARLDQRFGALEDWVQNTEIQFRDVQHSLSNLTSVVSELQDDFRASSIALDDNSVQMLNHERRIGRLEKRVKVA